MPAFAFSAIAGTHLPIQEGWKAELAWVAGYVIRQFICPKAVTHPSTNRAQCSKKNCVDRDQCVTATLNRHGRCQAVLDTNWAFTRSDRRTDRSVRPRLRPTVCQTGRTDCSRTAHICQSNQCGLLANYNTALRCSVIGRPTGQSVRPAGRIVHTLRQSDRQSDEIKHV